MAKIERTSGASQQGIVRDRESIGKGKVETERVKGVERVENEEIKPKFTQALEDVELKITKENLNNYLNEIREIARVLVDSPNLKKLENYKNKIKSFLKNVLKEIYNVESKEGLAKIGKEQKIFLTINRVDKSLENLTKKFINEQKEALSIIKDVEGIQGLLYDMLI